MSSAEGNHTVKIGFPCLRYVTLAIAFGCALSVGVRLVKPLAGLANSVPELDSFSEPFVAAAVLKMHTENLLWTYKTALNAVESTPGRPRGDVTRGLSDGGSLLIDTQIPAGQIQPKMPLPRLTSEWIQRFNEEIHLLREATSATDLERELLVICQENNLWNEFLDSYLEILGRSPESPVVLAWARTALEGSTCCDRTEELQDALQHLARFHRDARCAGQVRTVLKQWSDDNHRGMMAERR